MITKIVCAVIYTSDLQRSLSFYQKLSGLKLDTNDGKFAYLSFQDSNTLLGINLADKPEKVPGKQTIMLNSDNLENDAKLLNTEIIDKGWGKALQITDPDGNKIMITQSAN